MINKLKKIVTEKFAPPAPPAPKPVKEPSNQNVLESLFGPPPERLREGAGPLNQKWLDILKEENSKTVFSVMKKRFKIMGTVLGPLGDEISKNVNRTSKADFQSLAKRLDSELDDRRYDLPAIYDIGRIIDDESFGGDIGGRGVYEFIPSALRYLTGETNEIPAFLANAPRAVEKLKEVRPRFLPLNDLSPEQKKVIKEKYLHILYNGLKTDKEFDAIGIFDPDARLIFTPNLSVDNDVIDYVIPTGAYGKEFTEELILAGQTLGRFIDESGSDVIRKVAKENPDVLRGEMARVDDSANATEQIEKGVREATQEGVLSLVQAAALLTKHKIPGIDDPKEALKIILKPREDGTSLLTEFTAKHTMGIVGPFNLSGRHLGPAIVKGPNGDYVFSTEFKANLSKTNKSIFEKIQQKIKKEEEMEAQMRSHLRPEEIIPDQAPTRPKAESHLGKCPMTKKCDTTGRQPLQDIVDAYWKVFDSISE